MNYVPPVYFLRHVLGIKEPYDWQVECLQTIALGQKQLGGRKTALVAPNGSGKTANCIAPAVLYFLTLFPLGQVPLTSSSWLQVEKQDFPALRSYERNPYFAGWTFNQTEVRTPEGGFCIGFSTDNPGRAEGWHPKISPDIDPVLYVIDEAKSIPDGIFHALSRCTLHHAVIASSPGNDTGKFYQIFHKDRAHYYRIRVKYEDCPHIEYNDPGKAARMLDELGEDSPIYRSCILGEFTEMDNRSVVSRSKVEDLRINPPEHEPDTKCGSMDFAAGGDENVFAECYGNKLRIAQYWKDVDTARARGRFRAIAYELEIEAENIAADGDGMGIPIIDDFHADEFYVNEFRGGFPADETKYYVNQRAEAWAAFARAVEKREIILEIDDETVEQLVAPRQEYDTKGRLKVESKEDMAKRGVHSPDRADALVMALWQRHKGTMGVWTGKGEVPAMPTNQFEVETQEFGAI